MSRQWIRRGLSVATACCAVALGWNTCANSRHTEITPVGKSDVPQPNKEQTEALGGAERYQTFVSTDKPIYKIGERVYVRGTVLNAANHKPLSSDHQTNATIQIKGPKGDIVAGGSAYSQDSVWSFAWDVPQGQAGGEYKIAVTYPFDGHAPAERKFDIRAYRAPRLKSQITFLRDGYAPGDKVHATLDVKRAEGGVPAGAKVTVSAVIDGVEVNGGTAKVDADGLCAVSFDLPRDIPRGEGTLALVIEDGGVVETASKTIPILLQTVDLKMFPEGGDLVAGYNNRVYIQAKQPNGKPADLVGKLMVEQGGALTEFRTEHEGRGRFEFTPEANKQYYLSISEPAGIKTTYKLPEVKTSGAVIHSAQDVYEKGQPITVHVGCSAKSYRVALSKREQEIAASKVDLPKGSDELHSITFDAPADVDGVLTVTVYGDKNVPIAERLIFKRPAKPINVSITADKSNYVPGDKTELTIKATNSDGKPVAAVIGMTVTDDSVLEMVEKREQSPRLPVMVFLEPEVEDLADAHVYLDPKNTKAPIATDLLLGTQGWRRFALVDLANFVAEHGDNARRAVALKIQSQQEVMAFAEMAGAGGNGMLRFRGGPVPPGAAMPVAMPMAAPMPRAGGIPQLAAAVPVPKSALAKAPGDADAAPPALEGNAQGMLVRDLREAQLPMNRPVPAQDAKDKLQNALAQASEKSKRRAFAADEISQQLSSFAIVREYAHAARADRNPTDRVDFTETVYWNAGVKTDEKTGEAKVSFALNDSVTTFKVFADAFSSGGEVGAAALGVEAVQPFYAEAKLPLEVTAGDQILLPISLVNATNDNLSGANVNVDLKGDFKLLALQNALSSINGGQRIRCIQPIDIGSGNGEKDFVLSTTAGAFTDKVQRKLSVKPKGFPIEVPFGGMLEPGKSVTHTIVIPKNVVDQSMVSNSAVYPTPLANLTEALQRLIMDPYGCFEQTSSTSYPLTMAQQYFLSHTGVKPELVESSRAKLDAGYKRLVGFWCPDRGYEWFGENPGHEALTAFGLMHFTDMAEVREVDKNMINSTRTWLMKQKDGKGGFSRNRRSLHTWTEDKDCSNAYILWALLESGQPVAELKPELESIKTAAEKTQDQYAVALAANALHLAGEKVHAKKLMDRLASKQKADGSVDGVKSSIVGSGGEALQIEGAALATLAWMRDPAYAGNVEKSIKFLADSCKAGRYGSTQSTVLALRDIVTYDKLRARPKAPGKVRLYVDGQSIGDWQDFDQTTQGAIKLPDLSELMTPGEHKLELRMEGGGPMPYSIAVRYNALTPASSKDCKLDIAVKMSQDKITEGVATEAKVTVTNKTKDVLPNPVAIVGLPGGLEPRHDQLKELVKKGTIDAYEVIGREVVLYWRTLPGDAKVEVPLNVIAAVPGTYTGPSSRTYLYYTDEHKQWVDGVKVEIAAK